MALNDWWKETGKVKVQYAHWLGLFRREVHFEEHTPSRLTIPSVKSAAGENRSILHNVTISTPNSLSAERSLTSAINLFTSGVTPFDKQSGSVGLAGVLLNEEASAPPIQPAISPTAEGHTKINPMPAKTEIPLSKRLAYLLQPSTDMLLSKSGPLEWPGTLFEYQMEGIKALTTHNALLLADDMGLGKTIQAVGALRILFLQRQIESCLLIVPASLISQWRKELHHWAPELRISTIKGPASERAWQWRSPAHTYLTSYETFRSDFTDNPQSPPRRYVWDVVILDEAQKIKNRDVEVSRKCKQLRRRRAWALTGTPIENRMDDLVSILEFVTPLKDGESPLRLTLGAELIDRHKRLQVRRKKSDVLPQLPPKIVSQIVLQLDAQQRESYERAEKEGIMQLQEKGQTARIENVLELIMRLKQICNFCPESGQSAKLEDIYERLATLESEGHRALIFTQFTDEGYGARAIVSKLQSLQPLLYTGDLSLSQRDATIKEFKENPEHRVLVLSIRAGGQGLNLQDASYVFHFDRWWNPAVERQAEGRSHRLGQIFPVNVYKYICEGTIEEKIDKILQEKQLLFNEIVDDVSIDLKTKLTSEELFGLFGLTPPEQTKSSQRGPKTPADYTVMNGVEFEGYVKRLLVRKGWSVETTPLTRDGGIDLIARRNDDVGVEVILYIQCKNYSSPVGVDVVRELNGVLPKQLSGVRGVLVCPSGFTADAISFAKDRGVALWDRHHLFELSGE